MITLKTNKEYTRNLRTVSTSPHTLGPLPVPPWYKPSHPTDGKQVGSLRAAQEWERALTNPHPSITARQKKGHVLDGIAQQRKKHPPESTLGQAWQLLPKANMLPSLPGTVRTEPQGQRVQSAAQGPSAEAWQGTDVCSHFSFRCTGCLSRASGCGGPDRGGEEPQGTKPNSKLYSLISFLIKKFKVEKTTKYKSFPDAFHYHRTRHL